MLVPVPVAEAAAAAPVLSDESNSCDSRAPREVFPCRRSTRTTTRETPAARKSNAGVVAVVTVVAVVVTRHEKHHPHRSGFDVIEEVLLAGCGGVGVP